jgi:hypothetical protein
MLKNKPVQFIFYLLSFLFLAVFVLKIDGKILFKNYQIKFVSDHQFIKKGSSTTSAIEKKRVDSSSHFIDTSKICVYQEKTEDQLGNYVDSLVLVTSQEINESTIKESPFLFNYPVNGVYPLDAFFESLYSSDTSTGLYRIAHYGDSQIEGDRMTAELRKLFKTKFPCDGVGYVPMKDITDPVTYLRQSDASWNRYTVFTNKIKGFAYGQGGSVYRYSPATKATITLNILTSYKKSYLYYGYGSDSSFVDVYSSRNNLLATHQLDKKTVFNRIDLGLSSNETNLHFVFRGPSPSVYGVSFDGNKGIQFDNYGLRGQSGDDLMLIPQSQLIEMFTKTNTGMAIVQFGGNVVQGLKTESSVNFYGDMYTKLYLHFQSALKKGSMLVIGINDVSRSVNGTYESYPNIGALRYLQRKAAIDKGMAFFDIYQLMGGENSIKIWNQKGLASKDGHFGDKGRNIVCKELYKALIFEYKKYLQRKK